MIEDKIKDREELAELCEQLRIKNKKIGFTSGSFDILHSGHVSYLEEAKTKCDVLIVGVNSDKSVKKYKGDDRPIVGQKDRIRLMAALDSVDYVFLFDERRNKDNIEILKPDYYIKAGDYSKEELTSAVYLKPWGGEVILIKPKKGISSSKIVEKIVKLNKQSAKNENVPTKMQPAVFLDRDGVINKEIHFLHEPEKFEFLPEVIDAVKQIQNMHYRIVIVTNQGGIGLGYFTKEDFFKVNSKMLGEFSKNGINIDKIYFCPHSKSEKCNCRKPKTGMFDRAKKELNIDMKKSFTIGDMNSDIEAGKAAGTKTILVETGHGKSEKKGNPDKIANNLQNAIAWIKQVEGS